MDPKRPRPLHLEVAAPLYPLHLPNNAPRFDNQALQRFAEEDLGAGFSVELLADRLHLAPTFTRYLLRGTRQPSLVTYTAMLAEAGLPLGAFLRGLHLGPPGPHN